VKTDAEVLNAKQVLEDWKKYGTKIVPENKAANKTDAELWASSHLVSSAMNEDSVIPRPFRMSGYVPFNGPVCVAAVIAQSAPAIVFWHFINQSQNALVNYYNRNPSSPVTKEMILKSYLCAVTSAVGIAWGSSVLVKKAFAQRPETLRTVLRFVALPASMVAGVSNCYMMRRHELQSGITVLEEDGKEVGVSQAAAKKALNEMMVSRALLAAPTFLTPPLLMSLPPLARICARSSAATLFFSSVFTIGAFAIGLPATIAMFPQIGSISKENLEPEIAAKTTSTKLFYNKGL